MLRIEGAVRGSPKAEGSMDNDEATTAIFTAGDDRNDAGVKDCCDIYRTVAGERWSQYSDYPGDDRLKVYRAAGLRCRKLKMNDGFCNRASAVKTVLSLRLL